MSNATLGSILGYGVRHAVKAALAAFVLAYAVDYGRFFYAGLQAGGAADLVITPVARGEGVSVGGAVARSRAVLQDVRGVWKANGRPLDGHVIADRDKVTVVMETRIDTYFLRFVGAPSLDVTATRTAAYERRS